MVTINILGCCICRDIFRINDHPEKYKVNKFIQSVSPVSIVEKERSREVLSMNSLDYFTQRSNFAKRNILHDFNKTVKETIATSPSDYLIVDLCELRFQMVRATLPDGYEFLLTRTVHVGEVLAARNKVPELAGVDFCDIFEMDLEEVYKYLKLYAEFLKQNYEESKIILIKNYPSAVHLDDKSNSMHTFNSCSVLNLPICLKIFPTSISDGC